MSGLWPDNNRGPTDDGLPQLITQVKIGHPSSMAVPALSEIQEIGRVHVCGTLILTADRDGATTDLLNFQTGSGGEAEVGTTWAGGRGRGRAGRPGGDRLGGDVQGRRQQGLGLV